METSSDASFDSTEIHGMDESNDKHDTCAETSMTSPMCQQQGSASQALGDFRVSVIHSQHGSVPQDSQDRPVRGGDDQHRQGDGDRNSVYVQEATRPDQVRLVPGPVLGPSGREDDQGSVPRTSLSGEVRPGKFIGVEWPRDMAMLQPVQVEGAIRPNLGGEGHISPEWPPRQGRQEEVATTSRERCDAPPTGDLHSGIGCSGGIGIEEGRGHPEAEGGKRKGQGQGHHHHGCNIAPADSIEERSETRPCSASRSAGGGREEEHRWPGVDRSRFMNDLPEGVDNDLLMAMKESRPEFDHDFPCHCEHALSCEQKEEIMASLRHAEDELNEALMDVKGSTCDLMEVCCDMNSGLAHMVNSKGGVGYRVGTHNDMDLTMERGYHRASSFGKEVQPRWMWFSTPCGPNSPIQNMNQRTDEQVQRLAKKRVKSKYLIRRCIRLAEEQIDHGGHVGWEWPWNNLGWHSHDMKRFMKKLSNLGILHFSRLDGCQVGVVAHDTGQPMLKPWRIMSTSKEMQLALERRCSHDHEHAECMGHKRASQSAFYPKKMCSLITRVVMGPSGLRHHEGSDHAVFTIKDEPLLNPMTERELKQMKEAVRKLHVRAGHPTNRALVNMLRARGVDSRIIQIAKEHVCDECHEIKLPFPHMGVTFHTCNVLWHTMQMDIGEFVFGEEKIHVLLFIDEASRFVSAHELFKIPKSESRNATTEEVVRAIEQSWVQHHGLPNTIRCDPEGCFRGVHLSEWCSSRGVDLQPCPGEDHSQIGIVEATLGKLKNDVRAFMRTEGLNDPMNGVFQMVNAHNQMDRIGGFAPAQWAYGRLPSLDNRLFEGGNELPFHSSEGLLGTDLRANLNIRVKAEEQYRKSQALMKISRAMNSKPRPFEVFLPGDLVYYRRYKFPMNQKVSHQALDQTKASLARWFGPARVLATETRAEEDPPSRKPASIVWIVAAGRLKRCSPQQLRHCSEKEKAIAEASDAVSMPWSFTSLLHLVERGQFEKYDDVDEDENHPSFREREFRRARSATPSRSRPSRETRAPKEAQEKKQGSKFHGN